MNAACQEAAVISLYIGVWAIISKNQMKGFMEDNPLFRTAVFLQT
jgi:hypothetical protein